MHFFRLIWFWLRVGFALLWLELICPGAEIPVRWLPNPEPDIATYQVLVNGRVALETTGTTGTIEASHGDHVRLIAINTAGMKSDPSDPAVVRGKEVIITVESFADEHCTQDRREEVRLRQPLAGPKRYWRAKIERP